VRKQLGVGQSEYGCASGVGKRAAVNELGIVEVRVPVEVVVNGVVNPAATLATVSQVHRSDAEVVEEGGVVGAGAERFHVEHRAFAEFAALLVILRLRDPVEL